jgi:DNA-binding transcriptional MerR regulator
VLYSPTVPEPVVEIPNRPAFRASEVCEIAQIPPYVLKSWEKEFPGLGTAAKPGGPRVYRRSDVEQVVRIKHLLFAEGLTLAGVRRKLEGEPKAEDEPLADLTTPVEVRDKVAHVKQELRALLDLLSSPALSAPPVAAPHVAQQPPDTETRDGRDGSLETGAPREPDESTTCGNGVESRAGEVSDPELPLLDDAVAPDTRTAARGRRTSGRAPRRGTGGA